MHELHVVAWEKYQFRCYAHYANQMDVNRRNDLHNNKMKENELNFTIDKIQNQ